MTQQTGIVGSQWTQETSLSGDRNWKAQGRGKEERKRERKRAEGKTEYVEKVKEERKV